MRRLLTVLTTLALLAVAWPLHAGQTELLGRGNVALKTGLGVFTADDLEDMDHALFVELEGYRRVAPHVYLGGNVGATLVTENFLDVDDVSFIPVELNVKYAWPLGSRFVVDGGGGVSFNYAKIHRYRDGVEYNESGWLAGAQLFADVTGAFDWFSIGIYVKYQTTEGLGEPDTGFGNWRGGLQVGVIF